MEPDQLTSTLTGRVVIPALNYLMESKQLKTVAIVGSHPSARKSAPWDDYSIPIWVLNDAGQKAPRCNAVIQLHDVSVYSDPLNYEPRPTGAFAKASETFWEWMQRRRGVPIYMQDVDPRVPDSVKYPLDDVFGELWNVEQGHRDLRPLRYLTSSASAAIALALYQGYDELHIYGIENALDSEYRKQQEGLMFWQGYAAGRGVTLKIHCQDKVFRAPIYGYQTNRGETMLLSNTERLQLLGILPNEGSIATLRIVRELREALSFGEEETAESGLKVEETGEAGTYNFSWERELTKDVPVGEVARKVIVDAFTQLDRQQKVPADLLPLYERFAG